MRAFLANYISNSAKPVSINELPKFVYGDSSAEFFERLAGRPLDALAEGELARLRAVGHLRLSASQPNDVFVKTHNALIRIDGEPLITPRATVGALYVVRNPFDVALSFAPHMGMSLESAVRALCMDDYFVPAHDGYVAQYPTSWGRHVRSWLDAPGLHRWIVRYEDMLTNPEQVFGQLVEYLGLPKEPGRLARAIGFSDFTELSAQEQREGFVEGDPKGHTRFFREGRIGSWREGLSADLVQALIDGNSDELLRLGYIDQDQRPTSLASGT